MDLKNSTNTEKGPEEPMNLFTKGYVILFGVLLPVITLLYEMVSHACASSFFDPLPSVLHIFLIALVPASNLWALISVTRQSMAHRSKLNILNGVAVGVSGVYTVIFIPLLPLAVMAIPFMGLGLFPLSPILSLVATLLCRRVLKKQSMQKIRGLWWGLALTLGLLIIFEIPMAITKIGMSMATAYEEDDRIRGIRLLRKIGDRDIMLRMCYERPGRADIISFLFSQNDPVLPGDARTIYYRVTGQSFSSQPAPELKRTGRLNPFGEFAFDQAVGGDQVAGRIKGLSMSHSRIDGSIDHDAALSYMEWTLVFKNSSNLQQEARAVVALPPSGVVSRLTLWVDGEEREAAFAARRKTRQAYQSVVSRQRDPVLVTTNGPDQVLVQCFPVLPGKEMKIRFGITAPLHLGSGDTALMLLPHFVEHNFDIPGKTPHRLWIESSQPLVPSNQGLTFENPAKHTYAVRGDISNLQLTKEKSIIALKPFLEFKESWTDDPLSEGKAIIRQRIIESEVPIPSHLLMVIDGSVTMQPHVQKIVDALQQFPSNMSIGILLAGDHVEKIADWTTLKDSQALNCIIDRLGDITFKGGCDNVKALDKAWELTAQHPNSAILWVHGVQPVVMTPSEFLVQKWERRSNSPPIYDIQVKNGPNLVTQASDLHPHVIKLPSIHAPGQVMEKLFRQWRGHNTVLAYIRERIPIKPALDLDPSAKTSRHLVRLWAHQRLQALAASKLKADRDQAISLAVSHQLVTTVSGAVVLENEQQYKDAGLTPVNPDTVPTIPEPEVIALLVVVLCIFSWMLYQKRFAWRRY